MTVGHPIDTRGVLVRRWRPAGAAVPLGASGTGWTVYGAQAAEAVTTGRFTNPGTGRAPSTARASSTCTSSPPGPGTPARPGDAVALYRTTVCLASAVACDTDTTVAAGCPLNSDPMGGP